MKSKKARLAFETVKSFDFYKPKLAICVLECIFKLRNFTAIFLVFCAFIVSAQNNDSSVVKQFGLKGTVHNLFNEEVYPTTIIDSLLNIHIGMNCNQYVVKYFCEYQKMNNYTVKLGVKSPDYPLFAHRFKMPDIFINGTPINFLDIEKLQQYVKIIKFEKSHTKGLSKNIAFYFELE